MSDSISHKVYAVVFLLSLSIIAFQVNLIQIFSYIQWYHFAYMAISIALLGFGIAGSLLSVLEKKLNQSFESIFSALCFLTAISMSLLMLLTASKILHIELYHIQLSVISFLELLSFYLLLTIPFFFGALAIGMTFVRYASHIGKLYFYDLIGSGIGAFVIVLLSWKMFPHQLGVWIGIVPLLAGLISTTSLNRKWNTGWAIAGILCIFLCGYFVQSPDTSEYKPLSKAMLLPDTKKISKMPSPRGVIEVVTSPVLRHAPGLSILYPETVPPSDGAFLNGEWLGTIRRLSDTLEPKVYDYTNYSLPFQLKPYDDVLIFGDPTASLTQYALSKNPGTLSLLLESPDVRFLLNDRIFTEGQVSSIERSPYVHTGHLKSFLIKTRDSFDLIVTPVIGQVGSSGINAIREDYTLTKENMNLIWGKMTSDGVLSFHCWLDAPAKSSLKLFHLIAGMLYSAGIETPLEHIISVKSWSIISFYISKAGWDETDYNNTDTFCREVQFDPFINHGIIGDPEEMLHSTEDHTFIPMIRCILDQSTDCIKGYSFELERPSDNQPYFHKFVKLSRISHLIRQYGSQVYYVEIGYFFLWITFFILLLIALFFIILPLVRIGWRASKRGFTLLYFLSIGVGFMFIEIALIHQAIPYLGNPLYAFSVTLAGLLISSGLGSLTSENVKRPLAFLLKFSPALPVVLVLYMIFSDQVWVMVSRAGYLTMPVAFLVISVPGYLMGWYFPVGIKHLHQQRTEGMIPWAWGINGFFSVIAAVFAMILAIELGYQWLILLAVVAYSIPLILSLLVSDNI